METFTVNLEGGSPWGFSIQGGVDHRSPLRVGKVTPGGRASKAGLVAGDYILLVNGEDAKKLKHLQAQQIIKKSTQTVTLVCTKVRPGVTSPAVSSTSSFSFPGGERGVVTTPQRVPVTKAQPISRPKPPQAPPHARSASTGTSSECTPAGSSSPQSNVDVYDVKFQGMDAVCIDNSHPQENGDGGTDKCPPGMDLTCIDRSHPMHNGVCTNQNLSDGSANANTVPHSSGHGKVDRRGQGDAPPAIQFNRLTKDALATAINQAAAARVRRESSGEREDPSACGGSNGVSSSHVPVREEAVVQTEQADQPLMYQVDLPGNTDQVTEAVVQEERSDPPLLYQLDNMGTMDKDSSTSQPEQSQQSPSDVFVDGGSAAIEERVDQVEQVETQPVMYTFNTQSQTATAPEHTSSHKPPPGPPKQLPARRKEEEPVAIVKKDPGWYKQMFQQFQNTVEEHFPGATSGSTAKNSTDDDPTYVYDYRGLKVRKDSLGREQPEEQEQEQRAKKNQTPDEEPVYVYDYRGLRVRADSIGKVQESSTATLTTPQSQATKPRPKSASAAMANSTARSEVTKDDILSQSRQPTSYKTQQYNTGDSRQYWKEKDKNHQEWDEKLRQYQEQPLQEHPPQEQPPQEQPPQEQPPQEQPPQEQPLQEQPPTEQPPQEQPPQEQPPQEQPPQEQPPQEQPPQEHPPQEQPPQKHHEHSYSGSEDYSTNLTHMHPLLRQAAEEGGGSSNAQQPAPSDDQPELFERIEATKLQEAVSNASAMGQLQNLGVPSHLIPAVIDAQKEATAAEAEAAAAKKNKIGTINLFNPPPGPMAKALFDFTAQSSKELSFQKGDLFQLVHTVDDNWLEANIDGNEGIIPRNYVKVLTMQEYEEMLQPEPPKPTQLAKALFDFQGQSDREISFEKGDELHIEKKVDANWYEGFSGDARGIFPVAYVQIIEGSC